MKDMKNTMTANKGRMIFNGVILELELGPVETDKETGASWRNGTVFFDAPETLLDCGGGWIETKKSAEQRNEESGIAGGLRQGISYPNEVRAGDYTPYEYGEDESGWQDLLMARIFGDDWFKREDADERAREVYAAIQEELAKLA